MIAPVTIEDMDRPIDRDYARKMTELRTVRQDWHSADNAPQPKRGLLYRLTHRTH